MFEDTLEVVRAVGYDYIFIENVPQWLASRPEAALSILGEKTIGEYVVEELEKLGYNITVGILSAADYETAEDRERAIILACKKELGTWKFPKKHKFRPTVFETIGNFSSFEAGEIDPENKWNYGLPLIAHEIDFWHIHQLAVLRGIICQYSSLKIKMVQMPEVNFRKDIPESIQHFHHRPLQAIAVRLAVWQPFTLDVRYLMAPTLIVGFFLSLRYWL